MDGDAAHYQERKDSEDEWEAAPAPRPRSERRRLASMVSVRFSPEEAEVVRRRAEEAGLSLSRYVRERALGLGGVSAGGYRPPETRGSEDSATNFNVSTRIATATTTSTAAAA